MRLRRRRAVTGGFVSVRLAASILIMAGALAAGGVPADEFVDLTAQGALEDLRASNPEHFARIVEIVAGLREKPGRVEGDWLRVTFGARDVDLSRLLLRTTDPPKQSLSFTLDDTRYRLLVTRSDLVADFVPAH